MGNNEVPEGFKMTELGPLPEEWEVVRIGEIFEIQQGKALSPKARVGLRRRPFLRTANVSWGKIDLSVLDEMDFDEGEEARLALQVGDLLVCEGGDIGRTAIWEGQLALCLYQNHLHRLRALRPDIEPLFHMYWMQTAWTLLGLYGGAGNKTTIPNLSRSRLAVFNVPLPPLPEQRAIAQVLQTVQRAKEATERVIAAARELKKSLMRHLFTYGPVPVNQVDGVRLKETEIGPVPEHWEVVRLGEVAETTTGGTPSRKDLSYFGGNIAWVKSGELDDGSISSTEERLTEEGLRNSSAKIFPAGTLLIALYGATAGKTGILAISAATNQAVCALFPKSDTFLPTYMMYYFILRRDHLLRERYGGAQPNISQTVLRDFRVSIPPLPEQWAIADILRTVDRKIQAEEQRKAALDALFKTLLHHLMTGKVRVRGAITEPEE